MPIDQGVTLSFSAFFTGLPGFLHKPGCRPTSHYGQASKPHNMGIGRQNLSSFEQSFGKRKAFLSFIQPNFRRSAEYGAFLPQIWPRLKKARQM